MRIVQLPHLFYPGHESREFLEPGPLVVNGPERAIHVDDLFNALHDVLPQSTAAVSKRVQLIHSGDWESSAGHQLTRRGYNLHEGLRGEKTGNSR
jgi:hypothetical protein